MSNFISNLSASFKKMTGKNSVINTTTALKDQGLLIMDALSKAKTSLMRSATMYTDLINVFSVNEGLVSDTLLGDVTTTTDCAIDFEKFGPTEDEYDVLEKQLQDLISIFDTYGAPGYTSGWPIKEFCLTLPSGKIINLIGNFDALNVGPVPYGISVRWYEEFDEDGIGIGSHWVPFITGNIADGKLSFNNKIKDITGNDLIWWDALSNLVENSSIIDNLYQLSDFILGGQTDMSALVGLVQTWTTSKYSSIKAMATPVITSFKSGGVYGLATYILNYFVAQSTINVDQDYNLNFTDNTNLVPSVYLSGLASTVGSAIFSIGVAIAAAASKVVGLLIAGLGGIVNFIGHVLTVDYNDTYAALNAGPDATCLAAPHAISQRTSNISSVMNIEPFPELNKDGTHFICVPGGYLFFTIVDGVLKSEFHPDLVDRRATLRKFFVDLEDDRGELLISSYGANAILAFPGGLGVNKILSTFSKLETDSTAFTYPDISNDPSTLRLNSTNDQVIRDILSFNFVIFMLYTHNTVTLGDVYGAYAGEGYDWVIYDPSTHQGTATTYSNVVFDCYGYVYHVCFPQRQWMQMGQLSNPWTSLGYFATTLGANLPTNTDVYFTISADLPLLSQNYYDMVGDIPNSFTYAIMTPKYDAATFWLSVIVTGLVSAAIIATTVVVAVAATKALNKARLKRSLNVEQTYQQATENPSPENIKAYQKAVFKNNLFTSIFGGTKYAKTGRWDDTSSDGTSIASTAVANVKERFFSSNEGSACEGTDLMTIKALITGSVTSPQ